MSKLEFKLPDELAGSKVTWGNLVSTPVVIDFAKHKSGYCSLHFRGDKLVSVSPVVSWSKQLAVILDDLVDDCE